MTTINISVIYGIIAVLSLLLAIGYCAFIRKKESWLIWMHFSVFLVNFGYFLLSVSKNLRMALFANRISYLGAVFLSFFMLMIIIGVCRINYRKWLPGILIAVGMIIFLITASPGYLDCYYKEVSLVFVNGVTKLEKVYGPLHNLYFVYVFSYFAAMVCVIAASFIKKRIASWKHAALLDVVVLLNIAIWLVEQFIYWDFEFLSVSYIISEMLLLFLYGMLQDYDMLRDNRARSETVNMQVTSDLEQIITYWSEIGRLSSREKDVLKGMLEEKKRREIAEELCITENTVKKHVTNIFSKLQVSNRSELYDKIRQKYDETRRNKE